jgi:hypothetical protein
MNILLVKGRPELLMPHGKKKMILHILRPIHTIIHFTSTVQTLWAGSPGRQRAMVHRLNLKIIYNFTCDSQNHTAGVLKQKTTKLLRRFEKIQSIPTSSR